MTRKYHNHRPQTDPLYHDAKPKWVWPGNETFIDYRLTHDTATLNHKEEWPGNDTNVLHLIYMLSD